MKKDAVLPCVAGKEGEPYDWGAGCMNETIKVISVRFQEKRPRLACIYSQWINLRNS